MHTTVLPVSQIDLLKPLATVGITSSALPTGASTEATLTAINEKTPTIGQKTTALSAPVCLPSEQISALSAQSIDASINTMQVGQMTVGQWYKVVSLGTTPLAMWDLAGA